MRQQQMPTETLLPEAATAAAAGYSHTLLLGESGSLWAVGSNTHGQLGLGRDGSTVQPYPRLVRALRGVKPSMFTDPARFQGPHAARHARPPAALLSLSSCSITGAQGGSGPWPACANGTASWGHSHSDGAMQLCSAFCVGFAAGPC